MSATALIWERWNGRCIGNDWGGSRGLIMRGRGGRGSAFGGIVDSLVDGMGAWWG